MPITPEQRKRADEFFAKKNSGSMTVGDYMKGELTSSSESSGPRLPQRIMDILKSRGGQAMERQKMAFEGKIPGALPGQPSSMAAIASGIGAVGDIAGEAAMTGLSKITPEPIKEGVSSAIESVVESSPVQGILEAYKKFKESNPEMAKQLETQTGIVVDLAGALPAEAGLAASGKAASKAASTVGRTISKAEDAVKPVVNLAKEKALGAGNAIKAAKERIPVNIAERQAKRATLEALTPDAQSAARAGVELRDLQVIEKANPSEKKLFQEMFKAADKGDKDAAEIVGSNLRKPLELAEKKRSQIGEELGEYAKNIPKDKPLDVMGKVLTELEKTPGLKGIKVNKDAVAKFINNDKLKSTFSKGQQEWIDIAEGAIDDLDLLDFSDTVLSGSLTKGDRNVITQAFKDAVKRSQNPFQAHRYRQELFETLGGKKRAKVQLTDTQEQGLEAIRKGLADAIEAVSPDYKKLSKEYAQIVEPLKEMRKFFKNVVGAEDDVLDMQAGLLARRLTSNAQSGPEIRRIIGNLEKQLGKYGYKKTVDVERLQEFYNALSRYFDISKDTGLAGQVRLGTQDLAPPKGIIDMVSRGVGAVVQEGMVSPATQRDALKKLLKIK